MAYLRAPAQSITSPSSNASWVRLDELVEFGEIFVALENISEIVCLVLKILFACRWEIPINFSIMSLKKIWDNDLGIQSGGEDVCALKGLWDVCEDIIESNYSLRFICWSGDICSRCQWRSEPKYDGAVEAK